MDSELEFSLKTGQVKNVSNLRTSKQKKQYTSLAIVQQIMYNVFYT